MTNPQLQQSPPQTKPGRLLILACSQTKKHTNEPKPAIDYYDGPLWQTLRTADPTGQHAQVAAISAHYGLRDARFYHLMPYDMVMTKTRAEAMIHGGITTRWPRPTGQQHADTFGMHPAAEIASMSYRTPEGRFTEVAIVGGHLYVDVASSWIPDLIHHTWIADNAPVTIINDTIGNMRSSLRKWLVQNKSEPNTKIRNPEHVSRASK